MIDEKEVARYLCYGKNIADIKLFDLIKECIAEVEKVAQPKFTYRRFHLKVLGDNTFRIGDMELHSRSLAKNLCNCQEVIFFAATLGHNVDRLLKKYLKTQISKAVVIQATATAVIEDFCDCCQKNIANIVGKEGLYIRPRFSPGYGDLDLSVQSKFLEMLDANRTIGINLSDGNLMIPEKSVTAIIGLSRYEDKYKNTGCKTCNNIDCDYRRSF